MSRPRLYRVLEYPIIYTISQKLLAPGSGLLLGKCYKDVFSESRGYILDVGCGPLFTTPRPNGTIVGIDINPLYVKKYGSTGADKSPDGISDYSGKCMGVVCSADSLPFDKNFFDESRCNGLLHHLPPESALFTIKEMIRCTRPGGKIIVFDNVWPCVSLYRPLAWLTRRFDRGEWVRTEEELLELADAAHPGNWYHKRFTYSFTGLEALLLISEKP